MTTQQELDQLRDTLRKTARRIAKLTTAHCEDYPSTFVQEVNDFTIDELFTALDDIEDTI